MSRHIAPLTALASLSLLALSACNPAAPPPAALPALKDVPASPTAADTTFMQLASDQDRVAEALGQTEGSLGGSACVQAYAAHATAWHQGNRIALAQVADGTSVKLSDTLSPQTQAYLASVAGQRGAAVDRSYLHGVLLSDRALLDQASKVAAQTKVEALRSYANDTVTGLATQIDELRRSKLPCAFPVAH